MKIVHGVEMLEIPANVMGTQSLIHPVLIWDENNKILVDAGYPGQLHLIQEAIEKSGISFNLLNKIIITHQDIDHIGSLSSIVKNLSENVEVLSHKNEKSYIEGTEKPVKLAGLEAKLNHLPDNMKSIYEKLKTGFENSCTHVDSILSDDEELPYCGGIKVIFTPGHTPGHICLYLEKSKILICGDSLTINNGQLVKASDSINFDNELAKQSLKKLSKYDIETVICYHGGRYSENVNKHIAEIVSAL